LLDPGLAFGTGTHPTTALCLEALTRLDLNNIQVIDYGCGSGILAIASLKLGAANALCVDNDAQALMATEENAKKNAVGEQCQCFMSNAFSQNNAPKNTQNNATIRADLLIANILANPLIELAYNFAQLLTDNADIVLSGILKHQEDEIIQAYKPWFDITVVNTASQWLCIEGKRKQRQRD